MHTAIKQYVAAKAFIIYRGRVLVVRESSSYTDGTHAGRFDVVGGRISAGEHVRDALIREVCEETGLSVRVGRPFFVTEWFPVIKGIPSQVIATFFECHTGNDRVRLGNDHDAFRWIAPDTHAGEPLIDNLHPAFDAYLRLSQIQPNRPRVGVGVIITHKGKVLLGKRIGHHGSGFWSPPGGHLELFESWEDCAKREAMEECGVTISNIRAVGYTNDIHREESVHYVTLILEGLYTGGTISVHEPTKWQRWEWFSWDKLPTPLFLPFASFVRQKKANQARLHKKNTSHSEK